MYALRDLMGHCYVHFAFLFTLIAVCVSVCVCVRVCVRVSADISLYCAKNDLTDYPEIVWVCWV